MWYKICGRATIFEKSLNASLVEHCLESYLNGLSQIHIDRSDVC